jgi:hypothetical protein
VRARLGKSHALHKNQKLTGSVAMISIPETMATQADPIPRALQKGSRLDPSVEDAGAQVAILRRKNLLANQVIGILSAENDRLKAALERRAVA